MGGRERRKVEPTDDWELLLPLFEWPEQQAYEELRPTVLFGSSVVEEASHRVHALVLADPRAFGRVICFLRGGGRKASSGRPASCRRHGHGTSTVS